MPAFRCFFALASLTAVCAFPAASQAGTIYVNTSLASGTNNGTSWASALHTGFPVATALALAQNGDEIWVAQGTYLPGSSTFASLILKGGVALRGGFVGGETSASQSDPLAHSTILSGDLLGDDGAGGLTDNSHVIVRANFVTPTATLDGFTVRGGHGGSGTIYGGGMWMTHSDVHVTRCVFQSNSAPGHGGAVFAGGVLVCEDTSFVGNKVTDSDGTGGALALLSGTVRLDRCSFRSNSAPAGGGAIDVTPLSVLDASNCLFDSNVTNGTPGWGGAIVDRGSCALRNCTVVRNTAPFCGGVLVITGNFSLTNSILWSNQDSGSALVDQQLSVQTTIASAISWCDVQGGFPAGNMFDIDPAFVDPAQGDFRLLVGSPCADAGNNTFVPTSGRFDLSGNPRIVDDTYVPNFNTAWDANVDMGAYEVPNATYSIICAGDGSQTLCPCGGSGASGHGCPNADPNSQGALLVATGGTQPDTLTLIVTEMPEGVLSIFYQGTAALPSGVVFGDGINCIGGTLIRLKLKSSFHGEAMYPDPGNPSVSARSAALGDPITPGTQRSYQILYRDPDPNFCPAPTGSQFNLSNAITVYW